MMPVCGDKWSFLIVDPNALTVFPKYGSSADCDAKCAARIVGDHLPIDLDNEHR